MQGYVREGRRREIEIMKYKRKRNSMRAKTFKKKIKKTVGEARQLGTGR